MSEIFESVERRAYSYITLLYTDIEWVTRGRHSSASTNRVPTYARVNFTVLQSWRMQITFKKKSKQLEPSQITQKRKKKGLNLLEPQSSYSTEIINR